MFGLGAALCLLGGFYALWHGYGGYAFAATFTVFSFYFAVDLVFAARGVAEFLAGRFGAAGAYALGVAAFLAYFVYALSTGYFSLPRAGAIAAMVFIPLILASSAEEHAPGSWQDFLTLAGIWVTVKFSHSHWFWPYPGRGELAYVFTVLLCLNVALAAFVLLRRTPGIGYNIGWGRRWGFFV